MNGNQAYALSKKYTDDAIIGIGVIQGASCQIDSIIPSVDGKYTTITFLWIGSDGTEKTDSMIVYNGTDGKDGRGISDVNIDSSMNLIVEFDDGTTSNVGKIPIPTVEVGTTESVEYDQPAEVNAEQTATGIKLNFKIPKGEPASNIKWHKV